MGNSLQKEYTIAENPCASTPLTQIFAATNKKTKDHVSIHRCKYKDLDARFGSKQRQDIVKRMRESATFLLKTRHPALLQVLQPPLETRSEFYMVTEPVQGSIANLLLDQWPLNSVSHTPSTKKLNNDITIRNGLAQVLDALSFLKQEVRVVHLNLQPHAVFVTRRGDWKLGAFEFAVRHAQQAHQHNSADPSADAHAARAALNDPLFFSRLSSNRDVIPERLFAPDLDFAAPEYVRDNHFSFSSDLFSFACLYFLLRNNCYALQNNPADSSMDSLKLITAYNNLYSYNVAIKNLTNNASSEHNNLIPQPFLSQQQIDALKKCVALDTAFRPDPHDLLSDLSLFGEDVRALRYLSNINLKDFESKTIFLKNLQDMLSAFPNHILMNKVLPPLVSESRRNADLAICSLPSILKIAEKTSPKKFSQKILPTLSRLFLAKSPADIPLLCLRSMHTILEKTTDAQQRHTVFPFLQRCLKNSIPAVQIEAIKSIEECATGENQLLTYMAFKRNMLPQIILIIKETTNTLIRQTAVESIKNTLHLIEKQVVLEGIIPTLEYCLSIDRSRDICNLIIDIYLQLSQKIHPRETATKLLPILIQLSVEPSLQYEDFTVYMSHLRGIIKGIEEYRFQEMEKQENLRRIQQTQEAQLDDVQPVQHPQQHQEHLLDIDSPVVQQHSTSQRPPGAHEQILQSFIEQQERDLALNPDEENQLKHEAPPLQPTRVVNNPQQLPESNRSSRSHSLSSAVEAESNRNIEQQQQHEQHIAPPSSQQTAIPETSTPQSDSQDREQEEQRKREEEERIARERARSAAGDEAFENLMSRFMSDTSTPEHVPQDLNQEAEQQGTPEKTGPASWMADQSTPVNITARNPMDFFNMDRDEKSEPVSIPTTHTGTPQEDDDDDFESLLARHGTSP